jgi:mycobactin lysine-N-oxygenase
MSKPIEEQSDLIVVGAGAKAAAIATKVHAINTLRLRPIALTIVEATETAATWSGANGYTTGAEFLALTPAKDVAFPYQSVDEFGEIGFAIDREMLAFSWHQYLVGKRGYARWIDAGSPPVQHREYGRYLTWVLSRATRGVSHLGGRVSEIDLDEDGERWCVQVQTADGTLSRRTQSLVLTGPGIHRDLAHDPAIAERIFHCDSRRPELARIPTDRPCEIAIVGGGESALSSVLFLLGFRPDARLIVYTPALPMSRGESFLENRAFSTPDVISWDKLSLQSRREFVKQCDRGVFGPDGLATISYDERCEFVTGRVLNIASAGGGERVKIEHDTLDGPMQAEHDYVVNCIGFDLLEQLRVLLSGRARAGLEAQAGPLWDRPGPEPVFGRHLELSDVRPRLHIPGLAGVSQGPGFANLGCLGLLANRVLQPHVVAEDTSDAAEDALAEAAENAPEAAENGSQAAYAAVTQSGSQARGA